MDASNPYASRKRTRSRSPPPWRQPQRSRHGQDSSSSSATSHARAQKEQTRLNALQEAEQARAWVSQEDVFVLKQAKRKAEIRVKEGRAKPIDFLAVNIRVIDTTAAERDPLEDEIADEELDVVDPEGILDGLDPKELKELVADIEVYIGLETARPNVNFWRTMKVLAEDRLSRGGPSADGGRAVSSVAADVDRLLSSKTLAELENLEKQIEAKLASNEPIDVDYWSELLRSLRIWKAKASLKEVYSQVIANRLEILRRQQADEAATVRAKLESILSGRGDVDLSPDTTYRSPRPLPYSRVLDPEPLLKLRYDDKALATESESSFLSHLAAERHKIQKLGYVPHKPRPGGPKSGINPSSSSSSSDPLADIFPLPSTTPASANALTSTSTSTSTSTTATATTTASISTSTTSTSMAAPTTSRFATVSHEDFSSATAALYEREVARGVSDNEEIFTGEEELPPTHHGHQNPNNIPNNNNNNNNNNIPNNIPNNNLNNNNNNNNLSTTQLSAKHRPRKPRYFNRVQMGYEWNKYNQTHYDHDNPPPKVVQGYKFNIFYPDLIDKSRAPTYRIEREGGRKRGQSFAPAGEEDTCLIRFVAGPPYEDVAFRIVDKEWDYSAKRERGFRSSFEKGILQLHFQLKKIYYRK